jgi:hypothetical protein
MIANGKKENNGTIINLSNENLSAFRISHIEIVRQGMRGRK